jgi:carbon starvation protein
MVGYGGMLLESFVAVIALATFMILVPGSPESKLGPDEIYARGLAHFMQVFGISFAAGVTFGKLAFATFIYDTLDVSTRLGRYVIQEITGIKGKVGSTLATLATLAVPAASIFMTFHDPQGNALPLWKIFWPAFGASNQLLAALTLVGITLWLKKESKNYWVTGIPAVFMVVITLSSLLKILGARLDQIQKGGSFLDPIGLTAFFLFILSGGYLYKAAKSFFKKDEELVT